VTARPAAVVGLDLGGTQVKSALVGRDGSVTEVQRRPTRRRQGPDAVLGDLVSLAEERVAGARAAGVDVPAVGLASCGLVNERTGTGIFSASLQWHDVPLRQLIADRVGLPVAVGHDVRAGALAEARVGAGRGREVMLFMPIGTGVGAALVVDGKPYPGAHWSGVELGHTVVRPGGEPCSCGQSGCLDTVAGGAAIGARYSRLAAERDGGPAEVDAAEVIRLAADGDPPAMGVWAEAIDALAEALAVAVTLFDPSVVVIGGGVGRAGEALYGPLRAALASRLSFQTAPDIVGAALGDDAGCVGAGLLAWDLVDASQRLSQAGTPPPAVSPPARGEARAAVAVAPGVADALLASRVEGRAVCAYVYDLAGLARHARALRARLSPGCRLFYAVKANSSARVIDALRPVVDGFEIASGGELERVRACAPSARVAFGGPGKSDADIEQGLRSGVDLFAAESVLELSRIDAIAGRLGTRARVLLRVNPATVAVQAGLQMAGAATQFGIDEAQLGDAIDHARSLAGIAVAGLHLHSVSNNLDAERHVEFVAQCLDLADRAAARHGVSLPVVDLGGGFGIDYAARSRFDWACLADGLTRLTADRPDTELILEAGRLVVAECGWYAAEVIDLKRTHGTWFAIVRGGRHHFRIPEPMAREHPFSIVEVDEWRYPFARPEARGVRVTIAGELGTPTDILAKDAPVDRIRVGDVAVFGLAGAYRWGMSYHDFLSHPYPALLYVTD